MPANIVEIDESEATIASFSDLGPEESLVSAAKSGNQRAFEILVGRHRQRILALAMRYTRVREDAEDVVQQSFQKAFVYLSKFEGKSSFSTWLTRIAINEGLMLLRRRRSLSEVSIDDSSGSEETSFKLDIPDSAPGPENKYLQQEQSRIVSSAVKQLNPRTRKAIELHELGELSTEETARALGLSIGAVKGRVFHGRRKLRRSLEQYVGSAWTSRRDVSRAIKTRHVSREQPICAACG